MLEMMIVVLVIGVIVAVALPGTRYVRNKTLDSQARADLELLASGVSRLAWDTGRWPGGLDRSVAGDAETWDLSSSNAGLLTANALFPDWKGPYLSSVPLDPWGSRYFFDPDYRIGVRDYPVVGSFGPNRSGRNIYDEDNIYIRMDQYK